MGSENKFEEVLRSRYAADEAVSVSLLARAVDPSDEKYNDAVSAREALEAFGKKRKAESELLHLVHGQKRKKSGFSNLEVPQRLVVLLPEAKAEEAVREMDGADSQLYCLAPNVASARQLWQIDAEKAKSLFADTGEAGNAFRSNRNAQIRLPEDAFLIKNLQDWKPPTTKPKTTTTTTKLPAKPPATKGEERAANTFKSFFAGGDHGTALKKESPEKKAKETKKIQTHDKKSVPPQAKPQQEQSSKPRRRVVDDDDDDDDDNTDDLDASPEQEKASPPKVEPKAVAPKQFSNGPRLIEKTFMDEKGYLVTKKVWENPPPEPQARPQLIVQPANINKPMNLPKPKPKKVKAQPKGQKDISSFFKSK